MREGPGRSGDPKSNQLVNVNQTKFHLDYGSCQALNDFEDNQHRSWIRHPVIVIRGTHGEILNNDVLIQHEYDQPLHMQLEAVRKGHEHNLEGLYLQGVRMGERWLYRNPYQTARLYDDEIAVAECMRRMTVYINTGDDFYSLAEACHDLYLALLCEESIKQGGEKILAQPQPWCRVY